MEVVSNSRSATELRRHHRQVNAQTIISEKIMDKQTTDLALATLDRLEGSIKTLKSLLTGKPPETEKPPKSTDKKPESRKSKFQIAQSLPTDQLSPLPDINNDNWPQAVLPHLIISDKHPDATIKKQFRAVQMIGLMGVPTGARILDCGCGEGHVANEMANNNEVIGYDITSSPIWNTLDRFNLTFTTSREIVTARKPFDFITLYDVIDHLEGVSPEEFLSWIISLLSENGKVFVRCHPWTSAHGGHLYETMNKAYIHLALTADEIAQAGLQPLPNLKIVRPLATYDKLIENAGFVINNRKGYSDPVPKYFSGELLDRIVNVTWRGAIDHETALKIMSNQFIDYTLSR